MPIDEDRAPVGTVTGDVGNIVSSIEPSDASLNRMQDINKGILPWL
jgi:hypothetical protein